MMNRIDNTHAGAAIYGPAAGGDANVVAVRQTPFRMLDVTNGTTRKLCDRVVYLAERLLGAASQHATKDGEGQDGLFHIVEADARETFDRVQEAHSALDLIEAALP